MIAWLYNRIYLRHILTRPCHGCGDSSVHDAHLTRFGLLRFQQQHPGWSARPGAPVWKY
jgi:hypothetical protein